MNIKISDLIVSDSNCYIPKGRYNAASDFLYSNKKSEINHYKMSSLTVHEVYEGYLIKGDLSSELLDIINFRPDSLKVINCGWENNYFHILGMKFFEDQIPKVSENRCIEMKAKNNELVFKNKNYYKYPDKNGNIHTFQCFNNRIYQPFSDICKGLADDFCYSADRFWNNLHVAHLQFSKESQKEFLELAGIKKGLFSVQMGDSPKEEFFYSAKHTYIATKSYYDMRYNLLTKKPVGNYEIGSIFTIDGKEYTLKDDKTLDIPYGIDVFDIVYPKTTETNKIE